MVIFVALIAAATGCIKNDIPLPYTRVNFLSFQCAEQVRNTSIDTINRVVTVYLGEEADIQNVVVENYTLTEGAEVVNADLAAPIDLSSPLYVTLRLYQDWNWTIQGVQTIERYFNVSNQVGSSTIDVPGRRVVASVAKTAALNAVTVERIKLGPASATISPGLEGQVIDFTHPVEVTLNAYGRSETWTLYVEQSDAAVTTVRADAWTNVAWVYGQAEANKDNGIEYRLAGEEEWTRVPASDLVVDGGSFYARIIHLTARTTYQTRAYSDDDFGAVLEFTTGEATQVPNSGFDDWWLDGKVWCPWLEGGSRYWDTGNKGATTLGNSNSVPTDDTASGLGRAAKLETKFVGIGLIGKLAAGNLFVGEYVRTDGTNGVLAFGREFSDRPVKLRGYLRYHSAPIDNTTSGFETLAGQPDTCIIWCALIDQNTPFEIRTNPKNRQLFDDNGSYVVGYGKFESGVDIDGWTPFEFEISYKSTSRVPKFILITASASKYGDYFTGGDGSVLYLDNFELLYDY